MVKALRGERGTATVEFALVLPVVLLVVLAVVQVGLLLRDQLLVVDAAHDAAREAAVRIDQNSVLAAAAREGLDPGGLSVSVARDGGRGDPVRVQVTYRSAPAVPFVGWLFPGTLDLSFTATSRQEFEP
ncbi:MAG: TadE family type IV pilus minor pilin [Actinomycetota bacterium]